MQKDCSTYPELIEKYPNAFTYQKLRLLLGHLSGCKPVLSNSRDWSRQGWFEKKQKGEAESEQRTPHSAITQLIREHEYILAMSQRQRSQLEDIDNAQLHTIGDRVRMLFEIPWRGEGTQSLQVVSGSFVCEGGKLDTHLPKEYHVGSICDIIYNLNSKSSQRAHEPTTADEYDTFLNKYKMCSLSPFWTAVLFCGFNQVEEFVGIMEKHCNCGVERHFWVKNNKVPGVPTHKATNCVECFIVGFWSDSGAKNEVQTQHKNGPNYVNHPMVLKPYYYGGKVREKTIFHCQH